MAAVRMFRLSRRECLASAFHPNDNFTPLPIGRRPMRHHPRSPTSLSGGNANSIAAAPASCQPSDTANSNLNSTSNEGFPSRTTTPLRSLTPTVHAIPSRPHTPSAPRTYTPPGRARITVNQYTYHLPSYFMSVHYQSSPEQDKESSIGRASPGYPPTVSVSRQSMRSHITSPSPMIFAAPSDVGSVRVPSENASRAETPVVWMDEKTVEDEADTPTTAVFTRDGRFLPADDTVSGSIVWARTRKSEDSYGMEFAKPSREVDESFSMPRFSPVRHRMFLSFSTRNMWY
ncbi:hypothetical protein K474DRAFT_1225927 [Panus rudis PR-1116 ss-1]|nr:hypothetical protein K474DRAFT_1225927 [Panus rudis PR-1116 ss-1]